MGELRCLCQNALRRGRILYFLFFVLLHRISFFSEQMEYFWFVEHFVITIQHQLTCQKLLKNTHLLQSLVLCFKRATFLLGYHESKEFFLWIFFSALRSKHYSLPTLTNIRWSNRQKLIQSKIEVILPEQENSWMKPVVTGISVQGNLPSICQQWLTVNCDFFLPQLEVVVSISF